MKTPRAVVFVFGGSLTRLQKAVSGSLVSLLVATVGLPLSQGQRELRPGLHWDPVLAPLAEFVEKDRERAFRSPVPLAFVDSKTFDEAEANSSVPAPAPSATADAVAVLQSAGIPAPPSLFAPIELPQFARYDVKAERILVRGDHIDATIAPLVVFALTDALHHQVFDLSQPPDPSTDAGIAWQAVLLGDAERVEAAYRKAKNLGQYDPGANTDQRPLSAYELLTDVDRRFAQTWGAAMVEQVLASGGNAAVDRLFVKPPTSRGEVLRLAFGDASGEVLTVREPGRANIGATGWFAVMSRYATFTDALGAARSLVGEHTIASTGATGPCFDADIETLAQQPWSAASPSWTSTEPHAVGSVSTCRNGEFDFASSDGIDALRAFNALPVVARHLAEQRGRSVAWGLCVAVATAATKGPGAIVGDVLVEPSATASGLPTCSDQAVEPVSVVTAAPKSA